MIMIGGIDDLRPYCALGDIDIYANEDTCAGPFGIISLIVLLRNFTQVFLS